LVAFQIKHFLADFPLQGKYMLGKFKGGTDWVLPLVAHSGVHALFTLAIVLWFNPSVWWLSLVDFMALETLKGVKKIGEFDVICMDDLRTERPDLFNESGSMDYKIFERDIRPKNFVYIRNDVNSLSFTLQNGPVKEWGKNGCQVDTVIEAAKMILEGLNKNFPCRESALAITKLDEALMWLRERTRNREKRGVEGFIRE
jgi:hypothetical protein